MTNLSQLTAEIQKRVPELMELSFGCEILSNSKSYSKPHNQVKAVVYHNYGRATSLEYVNEKWVRVPLKNKSHDISAMFYDRDNPNGWGKPLSERRKFNTALNHVKTLGHPIYARHVLMAIEKSKAPKFYYSVESNGFIKEMCGDAEIGGAYWQLDKPLSEQTPETINALHSIFFPQS